MDMKAIIMNDINGIMAIWFQAYILFLWVYGIWWHEHDFETD